MHVPSAPRVIAVRAMTSGVLHLSLSDRSYLDVALPHLFTSTLCGREVTREWVEVETIGHGGVVGMGPAGIDVSGIDQRWTAPGTELRPCISCRRAWGQRIADAHGAAERERGVRATEEAARNVSAPDVWIIGATSEAHLIRKVTGATRADTGVRIVQARTVCDLSATGETTADRPPFRTLCLDCIDQDATAPAPFEEADHAPARMAFSTPIGRELASLDIDAVTMEEAPAPVIKTSYVLADYGDRHVPGKGYRHAVTTVNGTDSDDAFDAVTLDRLGAYPTDEEARRAGWQGSARAACGRVLYGVLYSSADGPGVDCAQCVRLANVAPVDEEAPSGAWYALTDDGRTVVDGPFIDQDDATAAADQAEDEYATELEVAYVNDTARHEEAPPIRRAPSSTGSPVDVDAVTRALLASPDGATVDGRGRPYAGSGILVALPGYGLAIDSGTVRRWQAWSDDESSDAVRRWVGRVARKVTEHASYWFGSWTDASGALHLDVAESFSAADEAEAYISARCRGEREVWHAGERRTVPMVRPELPSFVPAEAVPFAVDTRRRYSAKRAGVRLPFVRNVASFAVVSPSGQAAIAAEYASLPEWDDAAEAAFRVFREETLRQLDHLTREGLTVQVETVDPYDAAGGGLLDMFADISERKVVRILSTRSTGGHPFLSDDDNDAFRAVHDVWGHAAAGRGVDRHGEEAAYLSHARMYSPLARRALATETRGQNAAMIASGGVFDVQRVALLPHWASTSRALVPTADEMPGAVGQAVTMHLAAGLTFH